MQAAVAQAAQEGTREGGRRQADLSHDAHKLIRVSPSPGRQIDIPQLFTILLAPQINAVVVLEHLGKTVELGNELFDVAGA